VSAAAVADGVVPAEALEHLGTEVLSAAGMTRAEAELVSRMLVETSLDGVDSHGVLRIPVYARRCRAGGIVSPARIAPVRDGGGVLLLDGGAGAGHVVGMRAVEEVTRRAAEHGIAIVGVRNGNHLGALGSYARRIAERGHVGIVLTNASPRIAPTGGRDALLGNNPMAIAVPCREGPLLMDVAHSVVAVGKIRMAKAAGAALPPGWARNREGAPTTDPDEALDGLVEPVGGHKGYAMVLMIEILCGVLTGASSGPDVRGLFALDEPGGVGHQLIAIDIRGFTDPDAFEHRLDRLARTIRDSGRAPGVAEIVLPGDPEKRSRRHREVAGIPVTAAVRADLLAAAVEFGVPVPGWLGTEEAPGDARD
jgi:LDH2 family malate/lactate/ureidoglycolate dehydrogenase